MLKYNTLVINSKKGSRCFDHNIVRHITPSSLIEASACEPTTCHAFRVQGQVNFGLASPVLCMSKIRNTVFRLYISPNWYKRSRKIKKKLFQSLPMEMFTSYGLLRSQNKFTAFLWFQPDWVALIDYLYNNWNCSQIFTNQYKLCTSCVHNIGDMVG